MDPHKLAQCLAAPVANFLSRNAQTTKPATREGKVLSVTHDFLGVLAEHTQKLQSFESSVALYKFAAIAVAFTSAKDTYSTHIIWLDANTYAGFATITCYASSLWSELHAVNTQCCCCCQQY
eukprot:6190692-Pleurochrysis_carterae.AAC.4